MALGERFHGRIHVKRTLSSTPNVQNRHHIEQHRKAIEARLVDKEILVQAQKEYLKVSHAKEEGLSGQVRELELALATADAKLAAQQGVLTELRTYLDARDRPIDNTDCEKMTRRFHAYETRLLTPVDRI